MIDKFTDQELIKAFKDTIDTLSKRDCLIVPKDGIENLCFGLTSVLDLINRQQEEIERLNEEIKKEQLYNLRMTAHSVKSEAIKEFAEGVKKLTERTAFADCWSEGGFLESIDNLVKEMTEPSLLDKKFGGEQG